jgi:hypothetical protein
LAKIALKSCFFSQNIILSLFCFIKTFQIFIFSPFLVLFYKSAPAGVRMLVLLGFNNFAGAKSSPF